jgi:predicted ATP-binding protein involved in virulence
MELKSEPPYLEYVKVERLWGFKTIEFPLNGSVNFMVGSNGTGKTTIMRLVAATLEGNDGLLKRIDFSSLTLRIKVSIDSHVEITVARNAEEPLVELVIRGREVHAGHESEWFELKGRQDERAFRRSLQQRLTPHRSISNFVPENLGLCFLSVGRLADRIKEEADDDVSVRMYGGGRYETTLYETVTNTLENRLVRFFSDLRSRVEQKREEYQRNVFRSFLTVSAGQINTATDEALEKSKAQLTAAAKILFAGRADILDDVDRYYERYLKSKNALFESKDQAPQIDPAFAMQSFETILLHPKIEALVEAWADVESASEQILRPQNEFTEQLSEMFVEKYVFINQRNEAMARLTAGPEIPVRSLSSGEKQLFILLGEALLNSGRRFIYLVDEPEISLHINWQEKLVDAILRIAPAAQIVFATHSPDILGAYGNYAVRLNRTETIANA